MTLYTLSAEHGGRFICTKSSTIPGGSASCLSLWIPLTVAKGSMPTGAAQLGTITRPDNGTTQVTWHGSPLYTFSGDKAAGDASGNGFKDVGVWKAATLGSRPRALRAAAEAGDTATEPRAVAGRRMREPSAHLMLRRGGRTALRERNDVAIARYAANSRRAQQSRACAWTRRLRTWEHSLLT